MDSSQMTSASTIASAAGGAKVTVSVSQSQAEYNAQFDLAALQKEKEAEIEQIVSQLNTFKQQVDEAKITYERDTQ